MQWSIHRLGFVLAGLGASASLVGASLTAVVIPTELQMPGTQPQEVGSLSSSIDCSGCHAGVDPETEPWHTWQGSAMSHSARDPVFWAALAVAEQDVSGSGDLCLRCHVPNGWLDGRSEPTDGSALIVEDFDGVSCHLCHEMTDPDMSEHLGVQNAPFVANNGGNPAEGWFGSAMYVIWANTDERLGPYKEINAPHQTLHSNFHRSSDLCGTCHDVSNPFVGDLAPNNGAMVPLAPGTFSGVPGDPVDTKAAFNNPPYAYGVVERTFSEHQSTPLSSTQIVAAYQSLPVELKAGALHDAYEAARIANPNGNYIEGGIRNFSCQACHMKPQAGKGCILPGAPTRADLPVHDLTGGNYWVGDAIQYLDNQGSLVGGGGLSPTQKLAMDDGKERAYTTLRGAGALYVEGDTVKVFNLTGHKLITGYPEGRRMWLSVRWYDGVGALLRHDGEYGSMNVTIDGSPASVDSIVDLDGPYTYIWETKPGISRDWAQELITLGTPSTTPLRYDRYTGAVVDTLGDLAAASAGTVVPTMHFVLNDTITSDNRIPPYQMSYDSARTRNALPVPETLFGNPGPGGVYEHWDEVALSPPAGAVTARIELLYQPTSWEYIQFLHEANDKSNAFLADTGDDLLEAWQNTGMAAPAIMAEAIWGAGSATTYCTAKVNSLGCTPAIGFSGVPSASLGNGFRVNARNIRNQKVGILLYSTNGPKATPFYGGTLCVQGPLRRTRGRFSGGTPLPTDDCSGSFSWDFNERIDSGIDPTLTAGTSVWAQFWSRDAGASWGVSLTDAVQFTIEP